MGIGIMNLMYIYGFIRGRDVMKILEPSAKLLFSALFILNMHIYFMNKLNIFLFLLVFSYREKERALYD